MTKRSIVNRDRVILDPLSGLALKTASIEDCRVLWKWRNDPDARKNFPNPQYVPYRAHEAWFKASLTNERRFIFIIVLKNAKVGMVRFDVDPVSKSARVHVNISRKYRSRGIGKTALKVASQYAVRALGIDRIVASIKPDNEPSIKMCSYAGFRISGDGALVVMTFSKEDQLEKDDHTSG